MSMRRIDLGATQRRFVREHARDAVRPIRARLLRNSESGKAVLLDTGLRRAWVPLSLVTHDQASGVFTMPAWLAAEKKLD